MGDSCIPIQDRKQHPKLWFDDGNIVLATNISRFRVHCSLLAMNSPVFADMLSMPQPDTGSIENGFEGLPVVEISDNDTDFTHLLCFFYDHRYYQGGAVTTFEKISGLLRMSTKYQMDDLRNEIIAHLSLAYPSTLENYFKAVEPTTQLLLFPPFRGQHFAVVTLARETDASILLPAAMWRSACMITEDILEGFEDPTGTKHILSPADIKRCILQKRAGFKKQLRLEHSLPYIMTTSECVRRETVNSPSPCVGVALSRVAQHFTRDDRRSETTMTCSHKWMYLQRGAHWSVMAAGKGRIHPFLETARVCGAACPVYSGFPSGTTEETACNKFGLYDNH